MEQFNLTTAETVPAKSTAIYKVVGINLDWEQKFIGIKLRGENNEIKVFTYGGSSSDDASRTKAINLMIAFNKVNLSVKSLHKRIIEQLVSDGLLTGTITGTPD